MFSTKDRLQRFTPDKGITREEYINLLAEEYHTTSDTEAQEQITANLANFSYDPINYDYLKKSNIIDIFLQLLTLCNDRLVLHGIAGICNCCLDTYFKDLIIHNNGIELISNLLSNKCENIILNTITTLTFLITSETKPIICSQTNINLIENLAQSDNTQIKQLANLFLIDYCIPQC